MKIFSPDLEINENIPLSKLPSFQVPKEICTLIRVLFNLSKVTGNKIIITDIGSPEEFDIKKLHLHAQRLLYIADNKVMVFTYAHPNIKIKLNKHIALKLLEDYRNNSFIGNALLKMDYSENFLGNNILILNCQMNLFQLKPYSEIQDILNIDKEEVEIELELKDEFKSKINNTNK